MSRRTLFMVIIIFVIMTVLGVAVGFVANQELEKAYNKYNDAINAVTPEQFVNAINNNQNVIASGIISATEPVTDEYLEGEYISISRRHEAYVMDTRVVTKRVNGKNQTTSELYYHWKFQGQDTMTTLALNFMGYTFDTNDFDFRCDRESVQKLDGNERYWYNAVSNNISGTIFVDFEQGMNVKFYEGKTIDETIEAQRNPIWIIVFAIVWGLITVGSIVVLIINDRSINQTETETVEDDDYENF